MCPSVTLSLHNYFGGKYGFPESAPALRIASASTRSRGDHDLTRLSQSVGRVSPPHGDGGLARHSPLDGLSFRGYGIFWRSGNCAGTIYPLLLARILD